MAVSIYAEPENLWGYELVSEAYQEAPERSQQRILERVKELYPESGENQILKVCR